MRCVILAFLGALRQEVEFIEDDASATKGHIRRAIGHTDRKCYRVSKPIIQTAYKRTNSCKGDAIVHDIGSEPSLRSSVVSMPLIGNQPHTNAWNRVYIIGHIDCIYPNGSLAVILTSLLPSYPTNNNVPTSTS